MNIAPDSPQAQEFGALVLAGSGDTKRAESLMQELQKRFPFHTIVQSYWLPTTRAQIALVNQQPQQAIDMLQAALPVELGEPLSTMNCSSTLARDGRPAIRSCALSDIMRRRVPASA